MVERRYASWKPVAVRRWATEWVGIAAAIATTFILLLTAKVNYITFISGGLVYRLVTGFLVERQMIGLRDGADNDQLAVTLRLSRETVYAFDEGLIAFHEGWLVFSGRRCSFSLRPADLIESGINRNGGWLTFRGPAGRHVALFTVREIGAFQREWAAWRKADPPEGEAVLPPSVTNADSRWLPMLWTGTAGLVFLGAIVLGLVKNTALDFLLCALLILVSAGGAYYGMAARRALARIAARLPYRRPSRLLRKLGLRQATVTRAVLRRSGIRQELKRVSRLSLPPSQQR